MKIRGLLLLGLLSCSVHAAGPKPAAAVAPSESPAVDTSKLKPAGDAGTTVIGERDSDLGLYLTPWKEEHPDNLDPPPGLLDAAPQAPQPLDPHGFARQVQDAATVSAYRRELRQPNR
jgi:hypothetical protein